jgi:hypothetical protein
MATTRVAFLTLFISSTGAAMDKDVQNEREKTTNKSLKDIPKRLIRTTGCWLPTPSIVIE